jgi:hypothetical protein
MLITWYSPLLWEYELALSNVSTNDIIEPQVRVPAVEGLKNKAANSRELFLIIITNSS